MADPSRVLALDLGATRLKAGLVDLPQAEVTAFTTVPTQGRDGDGALEAVHVAAAELLEPGGQRPTHVGLATPGTVDGGRVVSLPGKFDGLVGRDLGAHLRGAFGVPALVVNDALAYAVGEATDGAGADAERVLVVTIGTGIGVCVLDRGRPRGGGPYAGGILGGHVPISDETGPHDTNGRRGTFEARCAAERIAASVREEGGTAADAAAAYAAHRAGDPAARRGIERYRRWLVRGLVALAHAHTPQVIVLGGGPVVEGAPILEGLHACVAERSWPGYEVGIRPASLGDRASLVGIARLSTGGPR